MGCQRRARRRGTLFADQPTPHVIAGSRRSDRGGRFALLLMSICPSKTVGRSRTTAVINTATVVVIGRRVSGPTKQPMLLLARFCLPRDIGDASETDCARFICTGVSAYCIVRDGDVGVDAVLAHINTINTINSSITRGVPMITAGKDSKIGLSIITVDGSFGVRVGLFEAASPDGNCFVPCTCWPHRYLMARKLSFAARTADGLVARSAHEESIFSGANVALLTEADSVGPRSRSPRSQEQTGARWSLQAWS